jgi:hypothetical protein
MNFQLSQHAREEIDRRQIPNDFLELVLNDPEQIVEGHAGKKIYQSQIDFGDGAIFLLRVVVAHDVEPPLVVTAYRTSKIAKYWQGEDL